MTKCKICGDKIKKCPIKSTNNWCHYSHHDHAPKPESTINYYNIIAIFAIVSIFAYILFMGIPNIQSGINNIKFPELPKSQPCTQTTSQNGGFIGTISQGDCSKSQLYGLSLEEQKLIGTWSIKTQLFEGSYTFNSDRTGKGTSPTMGDRYFKWGITNGILYSDTNEFSPSMSGGNNYRFVNNGKTLILPTLMGEISFDKSWW